MNFSILTVAILIAAALGIFEAISNLRGKRKSSSLLAITELVASAFMVIALFVPEFPVKVVLASAVLEVVLILLLIFRGGRRRGTALITIVAIVVNTVVLAVSSGWVSIPGLG